jgi:hypothetical protein
MFIFWRLRILKQGDSPIRTKRLVDHPGTSTTSQFKKIFFAVNRLPFPGNAGHHWLEPGALMLFLVWAHLSLALTYPIHHARRPVPKNELLAYN